MSTYELFKIKCLRWIGHQDWIRFSIRYRLLHRFVDIETIYPYEFTVDFFGLQYKGNLSNHIDWHVYFSGAYEKPELYFLQKILFDKKDPVVLDIGANTGHHSLFFSRYAKAVHSFEPYQMVRQVLEKRINDNDIGNIFVHDFGLGDTEESLEYYAPVSNNTGTGSFVSSRKDNTASGKVSIHTGDNFIPTLNLAKIDLVKIDVEGFEKEVLDGMHETIEKFHPIIIMEFSGDTKAKFGSRENMIAMFPKEYKFFNVVSYTPVALFFNKGCRLEDFDFDNPSGNILAMPVENIL